MSDIRELAVATDTQLAEILEEIYKVQFNIVRYESDIQSRWARPEQKEQYAQKLVELNLQYNILQNKFNEVNQIWEDNGRWTRAFLVTNTNGHVHKWRSCSTCFPSTQYAWLTQYSGSTEEQVVSDAGEEACTVCYPSAPAEVLNRPSVIVTADKIAKAEAKAVRDAQKAEREAQRIAKAPTVDGSELIVCDAIGNLRYKEYLKTERSAGIWFVDVSVRIARNIKAQQVDEWTEVAKQDLERVAQALAEKNGVTVEEIKQGFEKRIAKKRKEWGL